jgi:hypothetical protein
MLALSWQKHPLSRVEFLLVTVLSQDAKVERVSLRYRNCKLLEVFNESI